MEAALSLEALLEVSAALARDLQADFLPLMPRLLGALCDLVDEGERQPEIGGGRVQGRVGRERGGA